jgi:hypothetical protein
LLTDRPQSVVSSGITLREDSRGREQQHPETFQHVRN